MGKNFEKKINRCLSILLIVVLLPLLVTTIFQRMHLSALISGIGETEYTAVQVDLDEAEKEVLGIVAKEIGPDSPKEAILAQCVIARTNLYGAKAAGTEMPEALDREEMKNIWGEEFEKIYQQMEEWVSLTQGQVVTWQGDYIYAAYHAISAGQTRQMAELYEDSDMPYLVQVPCPKDVATQGYLSVQYLEKEEGTWEEEIALVRDGAGYVLEVRQGEEICSGEEFRSKYHLNSSCFSIAEKNGKIRIVTKGLGHGFGLSQHTAAVMAEEGKAYQEILAYFYPGTELKNVSEMSR